MVADINQLLSKANDKIEFFKTNIQGAESPQDIGSEELESLIQILKESDEAFKEIHQMENVKVSVHPEITSQLQEAVDFFLYSKEAQEKVGALQNALSWNLLEHFKQLDQHLKNHESLKRGKRVEKVDFNKL